MRIKLSYLPIIFVIVLMCFEAVPGQQAPSETVEELTAAIEKLESIDRKPDAPDEIKEINRSFLTEKRAALLPLLVKKRDMRRSYLSSALSALSADQILKVQQEMSVLDTRIKQLASVLPGVQVPAPATPQTISPSVMRANAAGSDVATAAGHGQPTLNEVSGQETMLTTSINPPLNTAVTANPLNNNTAPLNSSNTAPISSGGQGTPAPAVAGGQGDAQTTEGAFRLRLSGTAEAIRNAKSTNPRATFNLQQNFFLLALALAAPKVEEVRKEVVAEFTAKAEEMKTDKQTGAGQGTAGGTSLVTKAGIPSVFGFAVENGALTRTDSQTGVTFSGTPVGIIEALAKKGYIESYQKDDGFERFLRNFSFKITFDPNRGSTPGTFTGDSRQLAGYSLRHKLIDQRDPRDKKYTQQWSNLVENEGVTVTRTLAGFFTRLYVRPTPAFTEWRRSTEEAIANAAPADVERVLTEQLNRLQGVDLGLEVNNLVSTFGQQFTSFLKRRDDILDQVNAGWISTLEYNNERRLALPSLSNIKFIVEKGAYNGSLDLTANASLTFLNSKVPGTNTNRVRDFRFAGQLDVPLGNVATTGKFFLSFAGLYERLLDDEMLSNGTVTALKGDIASGQVKLTIPIRGTAFKIPLSFSFANRTELIKEKHVKGSFGFTFDLDSILARFNPFTQR